MDSENNVELKLAAIEVLEVKINHYSKELERVKDHYQFFFQNHASYKQTNYSDFAKMEIFSDFQKNGI